MDIVDPTPPPSQPSSATPPPPAPSAAAPPPSAVPGVALPLTEVNGIIVALLQTALTLKNLTHYLTRVSSASHAMHSETASDVVMKQSSSPQEDAGSKQA